LDELEGAKMWAGDEVEGGRADFGSWAAEKRRWAELRRAGGFGARWLSGRKCGVGVIRQTSENGLKMAMGRKGGNKKIKEKGFLLFLEFIF
jgi:hypothetical protein